MSGPSIRQYDTGKLAGSKTERGFNQSTASGRAFWCFDPDPGEIRVYDMAAQLSRLCRFNGAIRDDIDLYSVAQHCCLVSDHLSPELKFEGLLHDAHEAYIGDMIKPMKMNLNLAAVEGDPWKRIEARVERAVRCRFGLPRTMTPAVKEQDWHAFPTEVRDICPAMLGVDHGNMPTPWPEKIEPWDRRRAFHEFMARFRFLVPVQVAFTIKEDEWRP